MKLDINNSNNIMRKFTNTWKLNGTLLDNHWTKVIKKALETYFKENENIMYQNYGIL
jgi:hypothetical protein